MQLFTQILVINDSAVQRKIICGYLEAEGFITLEAGEGLEGLRIIEEEKPDLVISDLVMPGLDGVTFLNALERQGECPPVIILSANDREKNRNEAHKHGAVAFLNKPISRDDLYREVTVVLGNWSAREGEG